MMKNKKLEGFSKLKFTSKEILMKHMVIVLVGIWSNNHIRFWICLRLIVKPSTSLRLPFKLKQIWGQELQGIRMELDSVVIAKLDEEGMTTERFQEIMQSQQNPQKSEITLTTEEEKTVANMQTFLQQVSMKAQQQQMESIQNSDMSAQRFQSIAQAIQTDRELAMRMQALATEMDSE